MRLIWPVLVLAIASQAAIAAEPTPAPAPAPAPRELRTAPGVPLVLGVETSSRPDCTLGRTPQTRVIVPPQHGTATLRQARVRAKGDRCPGAPGYMVIYRSDPDFTGVDDLTLQVRREDATDTHVFRIIVTGSPPANLT